MREGKSLLAFYLGLAIVTGAVSFNCRPIKVQAAAELQQRVWESFWTPGAARRSNDHVFKVNTTRILMPALMASVVRLARLKWEYAFSLVRLLSIFSVYLVFHWYLRGWFSTQQALLGTLFVAATLPLTFNNYFEVPTDFPEILVYTLGLWCIRERRHTLLVGLIFVGTFNRETTIFLPLILLLSLIDYAALRRFELKSAKQWLAPVALASLAWLTPLIGLRWWTGMHWLGEHGDSLAHNLPGIAKLLTNFNPYNNYLFYFYLFGAFWVLPFMRWRQQPLFLRRALLSLPAFLVVYLFFGGYLDEPREIVNLYPLLVPAGLVALLGESPAPERVSNIDKDDPSSARTVNLRSSALST